jgi:UDP-glucuronate 4-epimerase
MAYWLFADAILAGRPIRLFDEGRGWRDLTFIDDAVGGTLAVAAHPPAGEGTPHRVNNLGKGRPDKLGETVFACLRKASATRRRRNCCRRSPAT